MSSESGDYDEDWEAEEPSVDKNSFLSATNEQFYSERNIKNAKLTKQETHDCLQANNTKNRLYDGVLEGTRLKQKVSELAYLTNLIEESRTSKTNNDNISLKDALAETKYPSDLVLIHGRHYACRARPPKVLKLEDDYEANLSLEFDLGAYQARIAAKRITKFRKQVASKEEKRRVAESVWINKRRDVRRSNNTMHDAIGVGGLSARDHLRIARNQHKQETRQKEITASRERQYRWYNCIGGRLIRAPEHKHELQQRYSQAKRNEEIAAQLKRNTIQKKQLDLRAKARAVISKQVGAYVPGSYLIKVSSTKQKEWSQDQ